MSSSDELYFLFSKYSRSCSSLMPKIHQLAASFTVHFVDIDHPQTRQKLMRTDIRTVPCIIVKTDRQLDVVEARGIPKLLGILQGVAQQRQQAALQYSQQSMMAPPVQQQPLVSTIVDPSLATVPHLQKEDLSYGQSLNSRLQPTVVSGPPPPQPAITNQIVSGQTSATTSAQAMANQHHQQTLMQQPFADPLIQQQPQQGFQGQPPQQQQGFGSVIDDSVLQQPAGNTFSSSGFYTPDQITGGGSSQIRDAQQASKVHSEMQRMAREREQADLQYNQRQQQQF